MSKRDSFESDDRERPLSRAERRRRSRSQRILRGDARRSDRQGDDRDTVAEPSSAMNVLGPVDEPSVGPSSVRISGRSPRPSDDVVFEEPSGVSEESQEDLWADTSGDHLLDGDAYSADTDSGRRSEASRRGGGAGTGSRRSRRAGTGRSARGTRDESVSDDVDSDGSFTRGGAGAQSADASTRGDSYGEFESSDEAVGQRPDRRRRRSRSRQERGGQEPTRSTDDSEDSWGQSWVESSWSDDDGDREWTAPRSEVWEATVVGRDALSEVDDTYSDDLGFLTDDDPAPRAQRKRSGGLFRRRRRGDDDRPGGNARHSDTDDDVERGARDPDARSSDDSDPDSWAGHDDSVAEPVGVDDADLLDSGFDADDARRGDSEVEQWSRRARDRIAAADAARNQGDDDLAEAARRGRPGGFDDLLGFGPTDSTGARTPEDAKASDERAHAGDGFWTGRSGSDGLSDFSDMADLSAEIDIAPGAGSDVGVSGDPLQLDEGQASDEDDRVDGSDLDSTAMDDNDASAGGESRSSRQSKRRSKRGFRFGRGRSDAAEPSDAAGSSRGWGFAADEIDDSEVLEAEILESSHLDAEFIAEGPLSGSDDGEHEVRDFGAGDDPDHLDADHVDAEPFSASDEARLEEHFDLHSDDDVEDADIVALDDAEQDDSHVEEAGDVSELAAPTTGHPAGERSAPEPRGLDEAADASERGSGDRKPSRGESKRDHAGDDTDDGALDALLITDDELFSIVDDPGWGQADWDDTGETPMTPDALDSLFDGHDDSGAFERSARVEPFAAGPADAGRPGAASQGRGLFGRLRGRRKAPTTPADESPVQARSDAGPYETDSHASSDAGSADRSLRADDAGVAEGDDSQTGRQHTPAEDALAGAASAEGASIDGASIDAASGDVAATDAAATDADIDAVRANEGSVAATSESPSGVPDLLDDADFLDEIAAIVDDADGEAVEIAVADADTGHTAVLEGDDSDVPQVGDEVLGDGADDADRRSGMWPPSGGRGRGAPSAARAADDQPGPRRSTDQLPATRDDRADDRAGQIPRRGSDAGVAAASAAGLAAGISRPIVGADQLASDEDLLGGVHHNVPKPDGEQPRESIDLSGPDGRFGDVIDVGETAGSSAKWPGRPAGAATGSGSLRSDRPARSARARRAEWPDIPKRQSAKRWPTVGKTPSEPFSVPGRQGGAAAWWTENPDASPGGTQVLVKAAPEGAASSKDEGLIPSRLTEPGPTDWFRTGLTVVIAWLISLAIMGVAMLAIDQFRSYTVLPLALMMTVGIMRFWRPLELPGALGPIHPATIAVILFTTVVVLFNATYVSEHVINDRQPGATLAAGRWLVDHPSIHEANNPGPFASVAGASSYAFEHVVDDDGTITVDFAHVMPVYLAVGGWMNDLVPFVADDFFVLWTAPFLAAIGLLAFYALASRLMRAWYAAAATAALAVNMIFMVMSRDVYHEMPAFVFMMAGLWLIVDARAFASIAVLDPAAYGEHRSKLWIPIRPSRWIVAGLCVGAVAMTGVDGLMVLAPVALYAAFEWARSSDKAQVQIIDASRPLQPTAEQQAVARGLPQFLGGVAVSVVAGWFLDGIIVSSSYLSEHSDRIVMLFVVGLLGASGALLVRVAWRAVASRSRMSPSAKDRLSWFAFALVLVTLVLGYTVWPTLADTHGTDEAYIERLQCNDNGYSYQIDTGICVDQTTGQPVEVDGTARYRSYGLRWVGWYIVETTLVLGALGLAFAVRDTVKGRARSTLPLVLFFIPIAVLSLSRANGWPDQPWVMRQFMPLVIPGFLVFAFWFIERLVRRGPEGQWPRALSYVGYLGAVIAIIVPAWYLVPVWEAREDSRGLQEMHLVCDAVDGGAVAIVRDTPEILGPGVHHDLIPSLRGFCGVPVSSVSPELTEDNWTALANAWAGENKRLYVIGRTFDDIVLTAPQAKNVLQWRTDAQRAAADGAEPFVQITNAVEMEWTVERRPSDTVVNPYNFAIARVDLPTPAASVPSPNAQADNTTGLPAGGLPGSGVTGGLTTNGLTTGGVTTNGLTTGGVTTNGLTTGGVTTNGLTTGEVTTNGLDGSTTAGATATDGVTTLGSLTGGATTGSATDGALTDGSTADGSTTDGSTADGLTTDGSTTDGSTTDGSTTGGSTTDGSVTGGTPTAGTPTGGTPTGGDASNGATTAP